LRRAEKKIASMGCEVNNKALFGSRIGT